MARESLEVFGSFFFPHHFKAETPDFHREIFELYEDENLSRVALCAPRGHAKSTITGICFTIHQIVHSKARFILLTSDTYSQSKLFLEAIKAELESNEKLRAFYGDLTSDKWSEGEIVTNGIMVKAIGAGMKVRGLKYRESRPDLVIVDDLENDELVENQDRRDKLARWFNGALLPSLAKDGRLIMIGTILHHDSLLNRILRGDGYDDYEKRIYSAIKGNGEALWPEHMSIDDLEKLKADFAARGELDQFYREYLNQIISTENQKFKLEDFKYFSDDKIEGKQLNTYITLDRAFSPGKTSDHTGVIVNSVDQENMWYIRSAKRYKLNEKELIDLIFDLHQYWKPDRFGIEQLAFEHTLKPHLDDEMRRRNYFFNVEALKTNGRSKVLRVEGLVPRFKNGSIWLKKDQADLIEELTQFPRGKWDDLADALAYQLELAQPLLMKSVYKKPKKYIKTTKWG